jgi:hypothetical protein
MLKDILINFLYSTYYEELRVLDKETATPIATTISLYRINRFTGGIHYVKSWSEYSLNYQPDQRLLSADDVDDKLIISAKLEETEM